MVRVGVGRNAQEDEEKSKAIMGSRFIGKRAPALGRRPHTMGVHRSRALLRTVVCRSFRRPGQPPRGLGCERVTGRSFGVALLLSRALVHLFLRTDDPEHYSISKTAARLQCCLELEPHTWCLSIAKPLKKRFWCFHGLWLLSHEPEIIG